MVERVTSNRNEMMAAGTKRSESMSDVLGEPLLMSELAQKRKNSMAKLLADAGVEQGMSAWKQKAVPEPVTKTLERPVKGSGDLLPIEETKVGKAIDLPVSKDPLPVYQGSLPSIDKSGELSRELSRGSSSGLSSPASATASTESWTMASPNRAYIEKIRAEVASKRQASKRLLELREKRRAAETQLDDLRADGIDCGALAEHAPEATYDGQLSEPPNPATRPYLPDVVHEGSATDAQEREQGGVADWTDDVKQERNGNGNARGSSRNHMSSMLADLGKRKGGEAAEEGTVAHITGTPGATRLDPGKQTGVVQKSPVPVDRSIKSLEEHQQLPSRSLDFALIEQRAKVQSGHGDFVTHLASWNDRLLSCGLDGAVKVWDTGTWSCVKTLQAHSTAVMHMVIIGGRRLVTAGAKGAKVWNMTTWNVKRRLMGHAGRMAFLLESGSSLLTANDDSTIGVWNLKTWKEDRRVQTEHTDGVSCLAEASGKIFSGGNAGDACIRVWAPKQDGPWTCLRVLSGHAGCVWRMVHSGGLLWSGSWDSTIKVWNTSTLQLEHTMDDHTGNIMGLALSGDGKTVVSCGLDKVLNVWQAGSFGLVRSIRSSPTMALAQAGNVLVTSSVDRTMAIYATT